MEIRAGAIMIHDALDYVLGLYWYTTATVSPGSYLNMELVDCRARAFLNVFLTWLFNLYFLWEGMEAKNFSKFRIIHLWLLAWHPSIPLDGNCCKVYFYSLLCVPRLAHSRCWTKEGTLELRRSLLKRELICLPHHKIDGYYLTHFQLPKQNKTYHLYGMHFFPVQ